VNAPIALAMCLLALPAVLRADPRPPQVPSAPGAPLLERWRDLPEPTQGLPGDLSALATGVHAWFSGDFPGAIAAFEDGLKHPVGPLHAVMRVALADSLFRAGRLKDAARALEGLLARYPALPWRAEVQALLEAARHGPGREQAPVVQAPTLARARVAFQRRHWEQALAAYGELLAATPTPEIEREALARTGTAAFRIGDLERSFQAWHALWTRHHGGLHMALKAAFETGRDQLGLQLLERSLALGGRSPELLLKLSEYYARYGFYRQALELYSERLRQAPRGSRPTFRERWTLGWLSFRSGQPVTAIGAWEAALRLAPRAELRQRLHYWMGRAAEARGDLPRALRRWRRAAEGPDPYYALLAGSRLRGSRLALRGTSVLDLVFDAARLVSDPVPLAAVAALPRLVDLLPAEALGTVPDLADTRAALFLLRAGHPDEARDYLRVLLRRESLLRGRKGSTGALAGTSLLPTHDLRELPADPWGDTPPSTTRLDRPHRRAAEKAWDEVARAPRDLRARLVPLAAAVHDEAHLRAWLPVYLDRLGLRRPAGERADLPLAYRDQVLACARERALDPFLVWALMHTESRYNERAVSPAGAMGLMQVMPETGARMQRLLDGEAHAFDARDLLRPEANLRLGCGYFGELLKRFRGQEALAIAAYNAGPIHVSAWVERKRDLPLDMFLEEIPFDETRAYVRLVMGTWLEYRDSYGFGGEAYLSNRVDPRVEPGVMF
jgi:soluble lytic murein transglycosylase-like protein/tetratricopeptide (TPR) repeat protein